MKFYYTITSALIVFIIITSFTSNDVTADTQIPYPEGYRRWTHIKSGLLSQDHPKVKYRGFNHVYANDKAFQGYESGTFPEGSIIVFDVVKSTTINDNYTAEGGRDHIDVMVKDEAKFPTTGGWGYAQFDENNTAKILTDIQVIQCYNCHLTQSDHVFSQFRK